MRTLFTLFLILLFSNKGVFSCPHCNIHNYMASSVYGSTDIFKGFIVGDAERKGLKKVKLLEVYKGRFPVDTIVETVVDYKPLNDTNIFCYGMRDNFGPTYYFFDAKDAGEIRYLVRGDSMACCLSEARTCIYGISTYTVSGGMTYFKYHYASAFPTLCNLLDSALAAQTPLPYSLGNSWQLKNVVSAYFMDTCAGSKAFLMDALERFANDTTFHMGFVLQPSLKGDLLGRMIRASKKLYGNQLAEWARNKLPTANSVFTKSIIYALVDSRSNTSEEILNMLSPKQYELYARALYDYASDQFRWWQWEQGSAALEKAKAITSSDFLKEQIEKLEKSYSSMTGKKK